MRASDIAKLLAGKVESVCAMLLPNGKRAGHEWRVGSVTGEAGKSMGVHLSGDKSGVWLDGETGQAGDLIGLWMAVKSIDLGEACREALSFLGIQEDRPRPPAERQWKRPTRDGVAKLSDAHATWLRDVRKLPDASLVAYKIASRGERIMFPSMLGDDLVFAKYRTTDKRFSADADCEPILFGWQAIRPEARAVVITEGELDAIAMHAFGAPALSVPTGAGSHGWIDREFDRLERFDTIYLCMDSDPAGQKCIPAIVERLGRERVKVVRLPGKDANDCLMQGVTAVTIITALRDARTMDPTELRNVGEFEDDVWNEYSRIDDGMTLPWKKTHDLIKLREGEVSIWAGVNGHGKALSLDTPIATPSGWSTMGDLRPGDVVFDETGSRCNVVAETMVMQDRPCYLVTFSDGSEIVADAEHEWLTSTAKARHSWRNARLNDRLGDRSLHRFGTDQTAKRTMPSIVTTKQIAESLRVSSGCWAGNLEHSVAVGGPLDCLAAELPADPYLLGAWLGDGSTAGAQMTSADKEIIDAFRAAGHVVTKHASKYSYGITGGFINELRAAGVIGNKHIPPQYLRASMAQRLALLQGLMDTDGCSTSYGRCEYTSTLKSLADGVLELVLSLGVQARMIHGTATIYGKDCGPKYRITFTPHIPVFRLTRKAELLHAKVSCRITQRFITDCQPCASVPVKCIEVDSPSHLYLAGRTMIPTHNSAVVSHIAGWLACRGVKTCVASMEFRTSLWLMKMNRQISGSPDVTEAFCRHINQTLAQHMYAFDVAGASKASRIMEVFAYARRRYQIELFVIDNLTKCGFADDDYPGQKKFVEELTDFARTTGTHVMVVAHMKKGETEDKPAGKFNVKGSGGITDMADTLVEIWRNKPRERAITAAKESGTLLDGHFADQADTRLLVLKQRATGIEPIINLWFDFPTTQFLSSREHNPRPMLDVRGLSLVA